MTTDPNLKVQVDYDNRTLDIRQSAIQTYLNCQRRFYWEYVRGIEPDYPAGDRPFRSADVGTLVHAGIAAYYGDYDVSPISAVALELEDQFPNTYLDPEPQKGLDLASIMVEGHIHDVEEDGADYGEHTVAVERPVAAPFEVGYWVVTVHGRIDRVVYDETLNIYTLEDTKTVAQLDTTLSYIQQLGRYAVMLAAEDAEHEISRVRSNQIKRVKRTKDGPFYSRPWLPFPQEAHAVHHFDLLNTLDAIVRTVINPFETGYTYNVTTECSWKCKVRDICTAQMHGDNVDQLVQLHYREKE